MLVRVPCDNHPDGYYVCDKGIIHDCGDFPNRPWKRYKCEKCDGTGWIEVDITVVNSRMLELQKDKVEIANEIRALKRYIYKAKVRNEYNKTTNFPESLNQNNEES